MKDKKSAEAYKVSEARDKALDALPDHEKNPENLEKIKSLSDAQCLVFSRLPDRERTVII